MKSKFLRYLIPKMESKSESFAHKAIKYLFYNKILENNPHVIEASLEKYFETRRADVYFKFIIIILSQYLKKKRKLIL